MIKFDNVIKHFNTITAHRRLVRKYCFKIGLYRQGLLHDLSKYSPSEFIPGVIYYEGYRSPNALERDYLGYSAAWLHHKGRNKHHYEYWNDHTGVSRGECLPVKMPRRYVAEMFCDRVAASRIYNKENFNSRMPLEYFLGGKTNMPIHPDTSREIELLLRMYHKKGEAFTLSYIKNHYLK